MEPFALQLKYTITPEVYLQAARLSGRVRRIISFVILAILAVLSGLLIANRGAQWNNASTLWTLGYALIIALEYYWLLPHRVRKLHRQQKMLHQELTVVLTEEAMSVSIEEGHSKIRWEKFHKWKEDRNLFLVYQSDRMFHMIPKRAFLDEKDVAALRTILTEKIGKPRK